VGPQQGEYEASDPSNLVMAVVVTRGVIVRMATMIMAVAIYRVGVGVAGCVGRGHFRTGILNARPPVRHLPAAWPSCEVGRWLVGER
jgi:hypothetical protein